MAKEAEQLTEDTDLGELYRAIVGEKTAVAEDSAVAQDVSGLAGPKVPVPDPGTRLRDRLRELGADQTDQSLVPARIPEAPPPLTNRARSQGLVVPAVGLLAIAGLVGLQLMEGPGVVPPERRPVEASTPALSSIGPTVDTPADRPPQPAVAPNPRVREQLPVSTRRPVPLSGRAQSDRGQSAGTGVPATAPVGATQTGAPGIVIGDARGPVAEPTAEPVVEPRESAAEPERPAIASGRADLAEAPARALARPAAVEPRPTRAAEVLNRVPPVYPAAAVGSGAAGDLELVVVIEAGGRVSAVRAVAGPTLLRDAAEDAVRRWRFAPALREGEAVRSELRVRLAMGPPVRNVRTRGEGDAGE